eukprot:g8994.t1
MVLIQIPAATGNHVRLKNLLSLLKASYSGQPTEEIDGLLCYRCSLEASIRRFLLDCGASFSAGLAFRRFMRLADGLAPSGAEVLEALRPLGAPPCVLRRRSHLRSFRIKVAPRILTFHMRRLIFGPFGFIKVSNPVRYAEILHADDLGLDGGLYSLSSVMSHLGQAHAGHFITHRVWPKGTPLVEERSVPLCTPSGKVVPWFRMDSSLRILRVLWHRDVGCRLFGKSRQTSKVWARAPNEICFPANTVRVWPQDVIMLPPASTASIPNGTGAPSPSTLCSSASELWVAPPAPLQSLCDSSIISDSEAQEPEPEPNQLTRLPSLNPTMSFLAGMEEELALFRSPRASPRAPKPTSSPVQSLRRMLSEEQLQNLTDLSDMEDPQVSKANIPGADLADLGVLGVERPEIPSGPLALSHVRAAAVGPSELHLHFMVPRSCAHVVSETTLKDLSAKSGCNVWTTPPDDALTVVIVGTCSQCATAQKMLADFLQRDAKEPELLGTEAAELLKCKVPYKLWVEGETKGKKVR